MFTTLVAVLVALALAWGSTQAQQLQLRVLHTSDLHMNLLGWDYYQDKPTEEFGLDRTVTLIKAARAEGINDSWLEAAIASPVYKMAIDWKLALPLHPEYRTLPMVWYVPPLSPINNAASAGKISARNGMPDVRSLRIPLKYLANLLTAGDTAPVERALERMLAMRTYQRDKHVEQRQNLAVLKQAGLSMAEVEEMYHVMAIANYEDRFVIPSAHREYAENAFDIRGGCGFSFGNGCSDGATETSMFGGKKPRTIPIKATV